ncbi:MAG: hypothetical protein WDN48_20715 [Pseudolabrys sp.]
MTNEWAIQFSRPLRDNAGSFLGVVLASYRLSHFIELYEKLKISDRGVAGLTGKDGIVRIRSLSGEIGYGSQVPPMPLVYDRVVAGEMIGNFYGRGGLDDVTRIGTFVVSPKTPFYVTVGYDESYLRAHISDFTMCSGCAGCTDRRDGCVGGFDPKSRTYETAHSDRDRQLRGRRAANALCRHA